jgi:UDP-glucose:(heptosyl)LPS alpha-1,3-glucosyltransferase
VEVVHIVKRFGPVGGMEECVFRLCQELDKKGISVTILCERDFSDENCNNCHIVKLPKSIKKPRWFSHLRFSRNVNKWLSDHPAKLRLVHSHERQCLHHVTTIYSTLYNFPPKGIQLNSPRSFANEYLERRELNSRFVKAIVPLSNLVARQIRTKHPECIEKLRTPITPAVSMALTSRKPDVPSDSHRAGKTIGFIGREWKRKGLLKVIDIWRSIRTEQPDLRLRLAGFGPNTDLGFSTEEKGSVDIYGWITETKSFFDGIDLLIHPARLEAYGMVVTEAMALQVPVLCSKQCGVSDDVGKAFGETRDVDDPVADWKTVAIQLLKSDVSRPTYSRSWTQVSEEYMRLYEGIIN